MINLRRFLGRKKTKGGPPGPRPTPRPRSDFGSPLRSTLTPEDIAAMNPGLEDAVWDDEDSDVNWAGTFSLFSGELRSYFLYRHVEYVVRVTDFMGTLTDLFKTATKVQRSVIADVDHLTTGAKDGDIQFRLEDENVSITVSVKTIPYPIGDSSE